MKRKKFYSFIILIILHFGSIYAQPTVRIITANSAINIQQITNNEYHLSTSLPAQCTHCYYWEITPSTGISISGDVTTNSMNITLGNNAHGYYVIKLTVFKDGICHDYTSQIYVPGPCGCLPDCNICFDASEIHLFNPTRDNLNESAGLSVETNIGNHCSSCVNFITYDVSGLPLVQDSPQQGIHVQNLGNNHYRLTVDHTYWSNNNDFSFEIMAVRDVNIAYMAKIYFTTGYSVYIDGYHVCHSDFDHDCSQGTRHDCWSPEDGVVSSRLVSQQNHKDKFNIYPNPTSEFINIKRPNNFSKSYNIVIYNYEGNLIYKKENINKDISIPTQKWNKGIYIIKILSGKHISSKIILIN